MENNFESFNNLWNFYCNQFENPLQMDSPFGVKDDQLIIKEIPLCSIKDVKPETLKLSNPELIEWHTADYIYSVFINWPFNEALPYISLITKHKEPEIIYSATIA